MDRSIDLVFANSAQGLTLDGIDYYEILEQ